MKFKPTLYALSFDTASYKAALGKYMTDWLKQAGQEWLYAIVTTVLPTWSGASRATFETIAKELGGSVPYGPQRSVVDRKSLGEAAGSGSGLELNDAKGSWFMRYHNTLRYLTYNEYNKAVYGQAPNVFSRLGIPNTPYHFQEVGEAAFMAFARYTTLPSPIKYLKKVKVN